MECLHLGTFQECLLRDNYFVEIFLLENDLETQNVLVLHSKLHMQYLQEHLQIAVCDKGVKLKHSNGSIHSLAVRASSETETPALEASSTSLQLITACFVYSRKIIRYVRIISFYCMTF